MAAACPHIQKAVTIQEKVKTRQHLFTHTSYQQQKVQPLWRCTWSSYFLELLLPIPRIPEPFCFSSHSYRGRYGRDLEHSCLMLYSGKSGFPICCMSINYFKWSLKKKFSKRILPKRRYNIHSLRLLPSLMPVRKCKSCHSKFIVIVKRTLQTFCVVSSEAPQ